MTEKIYKRCNDECFSYQHGANREFYCSHGPKLRRVTSDQRCAHHLLKPQNPEYDCQGFPMLVPADKLSQFLQSPESAQSSPKLTITDLIKSNDTKLARFKHLVKEGFDKN